MAGTRIFTGVMAVAMAFGMVIPTAALAGATQPDNRLGDLYEELAQLQAQLTAAQADLDHWMGELERIGGVIDRLADGVAKATNPADVIVIGGLLKDAKAYQRYVEFKIAVAEERIAELEALIADVLNKIREATGTSVPLPGGTG